MKTPTLLLAFTLQAAAFAAQPDTLRLDLAQAMRTARASALPAKLAESRSQESSARLDEARSALLPHVGASASEVIRSYNISTFGIDFGGITGLVQPFGVQDARVMGRVTVWDGSAWQRYLAAKSGARKSGWDMQADRETASLMGAEAYLALLRAQALVKARTYELRLASQLDTITRTQKKAGAVTQIEVLRAKSQLSAAQMGLVSASAAEEAARYTLLQILGAPLDAVVAPADSLSVPATDFYVSAAGLDAAAQDRPEVAAATAETDALRASLGAAKAGILPTVDLAGDYGLSGRRIYTSGARLTEDVAVQLNWSLWDGGGQQARVRLQKAQLRQSELRLENARTAAGQEARMQRALLTAAGEETARAAERVSFSEEEARLAEEKFKSGSSGNLEVITAQNGVTTAHEAYVDALYGYNRTRLAYLRSIRHLPEN